MPDTHISLVRAEDAGLDAVTAILNAGFSDYLLPIHFDATSLVRVIDANAISLADSYIATTPGIPGDTLGIVLVAYRARPRRGSWQAFLFAICVAPAARRLGVGAVLLQQVLDDARVRGNAGVTLEVLEPNDRARRLYERFGFQAVRRLVALSAERAAFTPESPSAVTLHPSTPGRCATICARWTDGVAPWQLSPETLRRQSPAGRAYYRIVLDNSTVGCLVVAHQGARVMGLTHLVVSPALRRQGIARAALLQLVRQSPLMERIEVPALLPEECTSLVAFLRTVGFVLQPPHQLELCCSL